MTSTFTRTDTSSIEPQYLALLEDERARWWKETNFEPWRNLYVSEYTRGFDILNTLQRYVPDFSPTGARILDIGCGDAGVPIAFAERGAHAAGLEVNVRSIERGTVRVREHGVEIDLREGVAESLPWPDASMDLVVLDNVLEHVTDREQSLAEIRRVLVPGGLLYLVTPKPFAIVSLLSDPHYQLVGLTLMPRSLQVWYFEQVRGGGRGNYDVGIIPTRRGVKRLLRNSGFRELTSARQLWIDYVRTRIADPDTVRPGKRGLARWLAQQEWVFTAAPARFALDVVMGSNFFIARKDAPR